MGTPRNCFLRSGNSLLFIKLSVCGAPPEWYHPRHRPPFQLPQSPARLAAPKKRKVYELQRLRECGLEVKENAGSKRHDAPAHRSQSTPACIAIDLSTGAGTMGTARSYTRRNGIPALAGRDVSALSRPPVSDGSRGQAQTQARIYSNILIV